MEQTFTYAGVYLSLLILVSLYRAVFGPTVLDRLIGVNAVGSKTITLLILIGLIYQRVDMFVDIALAYAIIRVMFTVFKAEFSVLTLGVTDIMVWLGTFAILFGAIMALSQDDYKRMLSYVIIAEIGYIVGGIGVANAAAMKGAIFHIVNDALMMACLFTVAGLVMYQTGGHQISNFKGIFRTMPVTAVIFTIGALAVIGVPPTCGFFSKWYLLMGGIEAGQWAFVTALLVCTLINVALFFRIFDKGLYLHAQDHGSGDSDSSHELHTGEAPLSMLIPACVLALVILLAGIFNQVILNRTIRFTVPPGL
jgi:multicomponent Na+:H+ antiporter subunit D